MQKYPARWIGVVMSALMLLASFGVVVALTPLQMEAIGILLVALAGVVPVVQALLTERKVYSPDSHMRELEVDFDAGYEAGRRDGPTDR